MNRLLKHITGKRIRSTLRQALSIAGAFYFLDVNYSPMLLLNLRPAHLGSLNLIKFLIAYGLIIFLFYYVLDFILRYVFLKLIKKRILSALRKFKRERRVEALRDFSVYKRQVVDFMLDYPIGLGYIRSTEIERIDDIKPTDKEKEDAIAELVPQMNKWICTVAHLLVTMIVVYQLYPVLMTCFLIVGIILIFILIPGIMIFIENVEVLPIILNEVHHRTKEVNEENLLN